MARINSLSFRWLTGKTATVAGVEGVRLLRVNYVGELGWELHVPIKGIGEVYSNLLENAGVDTIAELAKRVPANLHAKLAEQAQKGDARRAPTLAQVEDWVKQAKELGRGIEY